EAHACNAGQRELCRAGQRELCPTVLEPTTLANTRETSWKSCQAGEMWVREMLDVVHARTITYEY
ncbi:hypothetical protein LSAT2_008571, partial [Lamellibrachia satsuma]